MLITVYLTAIADSRRNTDRFPRYVPTSVQTHSAEYRTTWYARDTYALFNLLPRRLLYDHEDVLFVRIQFLPNDSNYIFEIKRYFRKESAFISLIFHRASICDWTMLVAEYRQRENFLMLFSRDANAILSAFMAIPSRSSGELCCNWRRTQRNHRANGMCFVSFYSTLDLSMSNASIISFNFFCFASRYLQNFPYGSVTSIWVSVMVMNPGCI